MSNGRSLPRPLNMSCMPCQGGNVARGCGATISVRRIGRPSDPTPAAHKVRCRWPLTSLAAPAMRRTRGPFSSSAVAAEGGNVVLGGEVERLVGTAPTRHPAERRLGDRHLGTGHVHERAVEDRGDPDRCLDRHSVGAGHELAPEVEVAVVARPGFREVGRDVRRDEARHAGPYGRVKQHALPVHDHVVQPVERGYDARCAFARRGDRGDVGHVRRCSGRPLPAQAGPYPQPSRRPESTRGRPRHEGPGDASAKITGGAREHGGWLGYAPTPHSRSRITSLALPLEQAHASSGRSGSGSSRTSFPYRCCSTARHAAGGRGFHLRRRSVGADAAGPRRRHFGGARALPQPPQPVRQGARVH